MFLNSSQLNLLQSNLARDCWAFLPELILCSGIVILLLLKLFRSFEQLHLGSFTLLIAVSAFAVSVFQWYGTRGFLRPEQYGTAAAVAREMDLFSGLLAYDNFTIFLRMFLLGFAALVTWLTMLTNIPDAEDSADFYALLLGATLGMAIMASANHLLMVFIGVEMASLPSYALAGFLKGKRRGSEASLKYVVYGGGASGVMLYGISLLAGRFGTGYLPDVAAGYLDALRGQAGERWGFDALLLLGTLFLLIGLGFKLSAVPFHFWCPDVFEGAAAEVAAFLSVASKGAAMALVGRLTLMLAGLGSALALPSMASWLDVARFLVPALAFFAALTATFGNLAAYTQTNLKRLLAYSTIAHAGYMMMGLAALNADGVAAVLFYLVAYLFTNLGAFAIVAFLRNETGSEELGTFRGLVTRDPVMTVLLAVFLLSLLGLPPLAGFAAKFNIFYVLFKAGQNYSALPNAEAHSLGMWMYALLVIGGLNTALSAVYYLNVLRVMCLERPAEVPARTRPQTMVGPGAAFYGTVLAAMIFVIGIAWGPISRASDQGVDRFSRLPGGLELQGQPQP
jgi:NADH-quinone oxidoreductase subunit N